MDTIWAFLLGWLARRWLAGEPVTEPMPAPVPAPAPAPASATIPTSTPAGPTVPARGEPAWPTAAPRAGAPWVPVAPPDPLVVARAQELLPVLFPGQERIEMTGGRLIRYVGQRMGTKRGVVAFMRAPGSSSTVGAWRARRRTVTLSYQQGK